MKHIYNYCLVAAFMASAAMPVLAARPAAGTGTFTTVIEEDFSLFVKGTPDNPDPASVIEDNAVLGNIPASLTHEPGWRGAMVHQAGGSAWVDVYKAPAQTLSGMVITPVFANDNKNGYWIASIRAKLPAGVSDNMEFAMNYGSGSGIDIDIVPISDTWTTVEAVFSADNEIPSIYFTFNASSSTVLVDDVKIEFYEPYLHAPKALPATDYDGTSFTARWGAVDEADAYLLSVYSKNSAGEREYVFTDRRTTATSMTVDGLEVDRDYCYVVKAVNDRYTSPESAEISVRGVTAPTLKEIAGATDNGFTLEWDPVPLATHYEVWAYRHHIASATEDYVFTDEKFSKVNSGGTVDAPEPIMDVASESLDDYMSQPGWTLYAPVHIDGAVGMDATYYLSGIPCYLMSPQTDLSQNDATVELSFKVWVTDTSDSGHQTQPVVSMLSDYGTGENPETVDQVVIDDFTPGRWCDVSVTLAKGSSRSRVMIFPYGNAGYMYVDNLRVVKRLNAGEQILNPVATALVTDHSWEVSAAKQPEECWAARARSYRVEGSIDLSDWSAWVHSRVHENSIAAIAGPDAGVSVEPGDGCLRVVNSTSAPVSVVTPAGVVVAVAGPGAETVTGPLAPGIYIVANRKVVVR